MKYHLGSILNLSGLEIRAKLEQNKILTVIRHFGFTPYVNLFKDKFPLDEKITSACLLCSYLLSPENYFSTLIKTNNFLSKLIN